MKLKEAIMEAKDMVPGKDYITANKPGVSCPVRIVKWLGTTEVLAEVYQANVEEWKTIKLPCTYKVRISKENEMQLKTKKAVAVGRKVVRKTFGKTTGVGVFDTWYIAFKKNGGSQKSVVGFMNSEYPERKTDWEKWVNTMRQRYNKGAIGTKPESPIAPYHANGKKK